MTIELISEYNARGMFLHFPAYPGAYTRGEDEDIALQKAEGELRAYTAWADIPLPEGEPEITHRIRARAGLQIEDADSEILLAGDRQRLPDGEFDRWCGLALLSAECVTRLYDSIEDKTWVQPDKRRRTFHGNAPSTAEEMLLHMDKVGLYYLSRVGITADYVPGELVRNRKLSIDLLCAHHTAEPFAITEQDGEGWTETKVLRRFIWHDRIHARALYRHGRKMGMSAETLDNPFQFV